LIPPAYVTEWREHAPWPSDDQVEQDLIISRVLVELYGQPEIREALAFRGGTALAKLYLGPAYRYSEDVDLVQLRAEPIGPTLKAMREVLDSWLGPPSWKHTFASVKLIYRIALGRNATNQRRLKLEINTREHESVFGLTARNLTVESRWFTGSAAVTTYELEELLATKLRALYQRKKGRDLFDLATALTGEKIDPERVVEGFIRYLEREGRRISRVEFEGNLAEKIRDVDFLADVPNLVATDTEYDVVEAADRVRENLLSRLD
jgi:predicted nucleotidyltransferase component of viral defense system